MNELKARIIRQLDNLSDNTLKQVSDFVEFLSWRTIHNGDSSSTNLQDESLDEGWLERDLSNLGEYEAYEWQAGELEQGSAVEISLEQDVVIAEV